MSERDDTDAIGPLTRELLLGGGLIEMITRAAPGMRILTDAEREASLDAILANRPGPGQDVWLFGYGSLIWNPTVRVDARRRALVPDWHRAFCLLARAGRGTARAPGLLLGLRPRGACQGVALRVAAAECRDDLKLLWRREMVAGSYVPRWVPMCDDSGEVFAHGIAFTIDEASPQFAGDLDESETVRRLATASGELGTCADYLFRTEAGLRALGIEDPLMTRLAREVRRVRDADGLATGTSSVSF